MAPPLLYCLLLPLRAVASLLMRHFFSAIALLCSLVVTVSSGHASTLFSSQPHILAFRDRQQIVLFAQDAIDGAMATRRGDGSWDVVVPNAAIAASLGGRSFLGPAVGDDGRSTQVDLEPIGDDDVRMRVRPAGEVTRVVAYGVGSPPRLMVDLLTAEAADRTQKKKPRARPGRVKKRKTAEKAPGAPVEVAKAEPAKAREVPEEYGKDDPAPKAAKERETKSAPRKPEEVVTTESPEGPAAKASALDSTAEFAATESESPTGANASTAPSAVPATRKPRLLAALHAEPVALEKKRGQAPVEAPIASAATVQEDEPVPSVATASGENTENTARMAPAAPPASSRMPTEPELPKIVVAAELDELDGSGRVALALADLADEREEHCLYTRVGGLPYCAPNGDAAGYVEQAYSSGMAHRIAAGATWLPKVRSSAPAAPYLAADRDFVLRAKKGWMLGTVPAYERALREGPDFPDAIRARMNIILIYASVGFAPELEMSAKDSTNPAQGFASAVLGDVRLEERRYRQAAKLYQRAAEAGGISACLAARGLAGLALAEGRTERAHQGLSSLRDLCPRGFVSDPDTERLRARIALAQGDADGALATLDKVEVRLKRSQRGDILRERATIAEGAGRLDEARKAWAELETGRYGPKLEAQGAIALARLEGTDESVDDGLSRLQDLPPEDRARARNELLVDVGGDALKGGDGLSAVAMILGEGMDPAALAPREQVRLAAAYRRLGLRRQAEETLDRVEAKHGNGLPETYWAERGAMALAANDLAGAETVLQRWQRSRGGNPSVGELELRARVLAGRNASKKEIQAVLSRLAGMDPRRATAARWRTAALLAEPDPGVGIALLAEAGELEPLPDLPDEELSETLWQLGRGAEQGGDPALALVAYRALGLGLPGTPRGAEASYRAARLLEIEQEFPEARRAFQRAATHPQGIDRRLAEAASAYHGVVRPWPRPQEKL